MHIREIFVAVGLLLSQVSVAQTNSFGPRVGIKPAEDRWITLTDGSRVYEGLEISYLLGQKLFETGRYAPVLLDGGGRALSAATTPADAQRTWRMEQVPPEWQIWLWGTGPVHRFSEGFTPAVDEVITPVVESLIYASGAGSDRVVFGFSPDHLNPFNEGRSGSPDNAYVASPVQRQNCVKPDFFSGLFNPRGWGPFTSNFGSDADEGTVFGLFGYGFGFKTKQYIVRSQIRFLIDNPRTGAHSESVFQTTGGGTDIFVAGSYSGFELGVEIQRRSTLLHALKNILPHIVSDFIARGFEDTPAPAPGGPAGAIFASTLQIPTDSNLRAAAQQSALRDCFGKNSNWVTDAMDGLLYLYGLWRFHHVLDQPLHDTAGVRALAALKSVPRIALIDSGLDYNDSALRRHVAANEQGVVEGFDFISWDNRPSDDNGHGTAAAKLLARLSKSDFILIPAKVVGAHGETHSSAIYDGFHYAVEHKVDAILVPWISAPETLQAYRMGMMLAASAQIPVFAPDPSQVATASPRALKRAGTAAVKALSLWLQSRNSGGPYESQK